MTQPDAPESGRSQFTEAPRQKQAEWLKVIQGIPGFKGRDRLFILRAGTIAKATSLVVAAGIIAHGLPFFEKFTSNFNLSPQQASAESMQGSNQRSEQLQAVSNTLEFRAGQDQYHWLWWNMGSGMPPLNNPDIRTGTVYVTINGLETDKSFQGMQSLYSKPLTALTIGGAAVDITTDKYYLVTGTVRNDAKYDLHIETGEGVKTPEEYTGRKKVDLDIPGGNIGSFVPASIAKDDKGNVLRLEVKGSVDSAKDGLYEYRLDEQGNIISGGDKVTNKTHRIYLPYTPRGAQN